MKPRHLLIMLCTMCCVAHLQAGEPGKLREIKIKSLQGLKFNLLKGRADKPRIVTSLAELQKAADGAALDTLKKQVDFTRDKLMLFAWAGSADDRLSAKIDDQGKKVTYVLRVVPTRKYRPHVFLYAIPRDASFMIDREDAKK